MHRSYTTTGGHMVPPGAFGRARVCLARGLRRAVLGAAALFAVADLAAADNVGGGWSPLMDWTLVPLHEVLLPDGRLLSYGTKTDGTQTGLFNYEIWDPREGPTGFHLQMPNTTNTDTFCSAQLVLPQSGDVALLGGDNWTGTATTNTGNKGSLILHGNDLRASLPNMNRARWYATATTLPNGEMYIQGGKNGTDRPEIRGVDGTFRLLKNVNTSSLAWWYPRNFVAPDGRIFGISDQTMYYVDTAGNGTLTTVGPMTGPSGVTSSEAMYRPGKILRVGGGAINSSSGGNGLAAAAIIDINGTMPVVTAIDPMPFGLHWPTATIGADGRVFVTGGALKNNKPATVNKFNFTPLIWDPTQNGGKGVWTKGTPTTSGMARMYHSTAILLTDGSILVGGGGAPGPQTNLNAEIYYPPYMYTPTGELATSTRPKITSGPTSLAVGQPFTITVSPAWTIKRVTLVKTGSVTHSFNMDQRFLELPFTRVVGKLNMTAPSSLNLATPGKYLLFVIDNKGVASLGKMVSLGG